MDEKPIRGRRRAIENKLFMEVALAAGHMCCVCRGPAPDLQVHHIDGDPSNNERSNLALLCLRHHGEAHAENRLGRRLDPRLISHHRSTWEAAGQHRQEVAQGNPSTEPLLRYLGELLTIDFSWEGTFRGEFGEFSALEDEEFFQLPNREGLQTKPRLFHTYWGLVGSRMMTPNLFAAQAAAASQRLSDRLGPGGWIETTLRDYQASPAEGSRRVKSVRHTAKAASILLLTENNDELAAEIAWRLLDSAEQFTNADGGCSEELLLQQSSIYASAYMLQLFASLRAAARAPVLIPEFERWIERSEELLAPLHTYMAKSWKETHWDWGKTPWQVNAPYIIVDCGPWLQPDLREQVRLRLRDELTPSGRLKDPNIGREFGTSEPLRAVRTAHALRCVSKNEQLADSRLSRLRRWLLKQDWSQVRLRPCDLTFLAQVIADTVSNQDGQ